MVLSASSTPQDGSRDALYKQVVLFATGEGLTFSQEAATR